jgi:nucleoside-triphosphatase
MTALLLTGAPGCGKTTLVRNVLARLQRSVGGFYTQEVRQNGLRVGFEVVTLDGERGCLAQVGVASKYQVGKYGVDLIFLEQVAIPDLYAAAHTGRLIVVDEIGPMELFSSPFRKAILDLLTGNNDLLGTIVQRTHPFSDQVKKHPQAEIIEVRRDNRGILVDRLYRRLMVLRI